MKTRVETQKFLNSHLRNPRGHGYWMYEIGDEVCGWFGSYTQTKEQAKAKAREKGVRVIYVLP